MIKEININEIETTLIDTTVCFVVASHTDREEYLIETLKSINKVMETSRYIFNIIVVRKNQLRPHNVNDGLEEALLYNPDYIKLIDNDDLLDLGFLYALKFMENNKNIDFIHSNNYNTRFLNKTTIDPKSITKSIPEITHPTLEDLLKLNVIHGNSTLYRSNIFTDGNRFDTTNITIHENGKSTAEEYFFHLMLLASGYKIGYVDVVTGIYRLHDRQKSIGKGVDQTYRNEIKNRILNHDYRRYSNQKH